MALRRLRSRAPQREKLNAEMDYSKVVLQKLYVLEDVLGQGTNAKVHKAREKKRNGKIVAVKVMKTKEEIEAENKGRSSAIEEESLFRHEIDVMVEVKKKLGKHPYILHLIKVCMSEEPEQPVGRPCLVLEYLPGGELFDRIVEKERYTESDAANLFYKLMCTIKDLHEIGVIHRDLKPENIIFGESDEVIKICDFGTAKLCHGDKPDIFADFKVGSPGYFAPETIFKSYHTANDIWSMGCILYTLLVGYMPFDMDDPLLIMKLLNCSYQFHEDSWGEISDDAKDLISKMLSKPYKDRITAEEVIKHKWFVKMKTSQGQEQHNLKGTIENLQKLNDESEKRKQLMREYFFNNVLSARQKVTQMISAGSRNVSHSIRRMRSRGMSTLSQFSQSSTNLRDRSNTDASGNMISLKKTKPKNRRDLMMDIRAKKFQKEEDMDDEDKEISQRGRSHTNASLFLKTSTAMTRFTKSFRSRKKSKQPKNFQALLTDIRTRNSVKKGYIDLKSDLHKEKLEMIKEADKKKTLEKSQRSKRTKSKREGSKRKKATVDMPVPVNLGEDEVPMEERL